MTYCRIILKQEDRNSIRYIIIQSKLLITHSNSKTSVSEILTSRKINVLILTKYTQSQTSNDEKILSHQWMCHHPTKNTASFPNFQYSSSIFPLKQITSLINKTEAKYLTISNNALVFYDPKLFLSDLIFYNVCLHSSVLACLDFLLFLEHTRCVI